MNEKGFAATSILYTILVVFILIMFSMISLLYSRNNLLNTIQTNIKDDIQDILQQYEVYENGSVVYFNPETATVCSPANAVSTTGTKTGCMKWYIFNDHSSNGYVNLLLDHNTTAAVAWNSGGNNADGMKEIKDALNNDISTWDADVKLTARLITADEVARISGNKEFDTNISNQWFYFGSNNQSDTSLRGNYAWLYDNTKDCINFSCNVSGENTYGYWTSNLVSGTNNAWNINRVGRLFLNDISYSSEVGVRPVIQVNKKNIIVNQTNLVVNGDLVLKNNTNFTNFKYGEDEFGGYVSYTGNTSSTKTSNEFIKIDSTKKYNLSFDLKSNNTTSTYYVGFREYDVDKKNITAEHVMYIADSLTSLAKDLKKGDTVVYLTDVSGFVLTSSTPSYQRGFVIWNYQDGTGYTYPAETYSRNVYSDLFDYGAIDTSNNTITLKNAWAGDTIVSGTKLSQSSSGGAYSYSVMGKSNLTTSWKTYTSDVITGIYSVGGKSYQKFSSATKYIKPFVWFNYNKTPDTTVYVKNVSLTVID